MDIEKDFLTCTECKTEFKARLYLVDGKVVKAVPVEDCACGCCIHPLMM